MSRFLQIRNLLDLTQIEMAEVLGCVQSNVAFLDRGQTVTPDVARKLIAAAAALGITLTFDQVYGAAPLPAGRSLTPRLREAHDWPGIVAALTARGWTLLELAVHAGERLSTLRALARGDLIDPPHATGCALLELHAASAKPARQVAETAARV